MPARCATTRPAREDLSHAPRHAADRVSGCDKRISPQGHLASGRALSTVVSSAPRVKTASSWPAACSTTASTRSTGSTGWDGSRCPVSRPQRSRPLTEAVWLPRYPFLDLDRPGKRLRGGGEPADPSQREE